jgi:DUF4097 and DUF4098 domain-containing protein YvlB
VAVYDPAGRVQLVAGTGSDVTVEVTRGGRDGALLRVVADDVDGRPSLRVVAPGRDLVYPPLGRWSNTTVQVREDGTFGDGRRGEELRIRGGGGGTEAWADLVVRVPAGTRVRLQTGVGEATARDLAADLTVGSAAAGVTVERTRGSLSVGTGSGDVRVSDVQGEEVAVGTGSGDARIDGVRAERLRVGTGSGDVGGGDVAAGEFRLGTGSGDVRLGTVRARRLQLGTGSGDVALALGDALDEARVGTGSGSVTLRLPPTLGATIEVSTGSGGLRTDVPIQLVRQQRGRFEGRLGDGRARVRVTTGSGGVRLEPAR